jgi:hypothetical protein
MVAVFSLLYGLIALVAGAALLRLFLGPARMRFASVPPIRVSRKMVGELARWALLIIVIAFVFSGAAHLLIVLGSRL